MLAAFLFNTVLDPAPEGGFVPVLAESLPVVSSDGLTITCRLRPGVYFSNGRELVADDVVYTFERFFDGTTPSGNASFFANIQGGVAFRKARGKEAAFPPSVPPVSSRGWIEPTSVSGLRTLNRYTFQLGLERPDMTSLQMLANPNSAIVPREEVERAGKPFGSRPVGTGPFMLKEWVRGVRMRFERNPGYFRADQPYLDTIQFVMNVDGATLAMMFQRGEIDFQNSFDGPDFLQYRKDPKFQPLLQTVKGCNPAFVFLNCELPPFTNRLVRQAMNYAVNKEAIDKLLLYRGAPARGPVPLVVKGFNHDLPEYRQDLAKARALLAEAGFANGFETTLWVPREEANWWKIALFVQASLKDIGVIVNVKEVSFATLLDAAGRRRTVPMGVLDTGVSFDDPKEIFDMMFNRDNITDEGCANNAFYSSERVQQILREAAPELDANRRRSLYQKAERLIVEDAPWIFLCQTSKESIRQPWLKGFKPGGFWPSARLESCWIER